MSSEMPVSALIRLWERMIGIYGHRWSSLMNASPLNEKKELTGIGESWITGLAGIELPAIGNALAKLAQTVKPNDYIAFRNLCLGIVQDDMTPEQRAFYALAGRTKEQVLGLPKPSANKELSKARFSNLYKVIASTPDTKTKTFKPVVADEDYFNTLYGADYGNSEAQAIHPIHEIGQVESQASAMCV